MIIMIVINIIIIVNMQVSKYMYITEQKNPEMLNSVRKKLKWALFVCKLSFKHVCLYDTTILLNSYICWDKI